MTKKQFNSELFKFAIFHNIDNSINENHDFDSQLIELGIRHRDEIKKLRFELQNQLYSDLSSLHDISKFSKPRNGGLGHLVYGKPLPLQRQM